MRFGFFHGELFPTNLEPESATRKFPERDPAKQENPKE
jgi:hypothetical protein